MYNKIEKIMKKCLKEKITITAATIVGFLITGTVIMAASKDYVHEITAGEKVITENLTNQGQPGKHGVLNIWENNISSADLVKVTNDAEIRQVGTERAFAAVNIANGADFINNATIVVDKNGALSGTAIEKGFGSLREDMNINSEIKNNGNITMENSRVAMGIKASGYKKQSDIVGKDNVTITNTGNINISNLTSKEITSLEKMSWNVLNKFKITAGEGSIGVGIATGDFVDVINSGIIQIDNSTPMTVTGTVDGVEKEVKIGGVGIAATNAIEKAGKRISIINEGEINLTGNNSVGIAGLKDVDIKNSKIINVSGDESVGIFLSEGATLENSGTIKATGTKSYAILSSGEIEDTVNLKAGSHIEGIINLGLGKDNLVLEGVGKVDSPEKIEVENIEKISIENSNIDLYGRIDSSEEGTGIFVGTKGENKLTSYATINSGTNSGIEITSQNSDTNNPSLIEVINKGDIQSKRYGIYSNAYYTMMNKVKIINDGNILVNGFENSESSGKPFVYSNGIYLATRPEGAGKGYAENNGLIKMQVSEEENNVLRDLVGNNQNMYTNIAGIRVHDNSEAVNNGLIESNVVTGSGVLVSLGNGEKEAYFKNSELGKILINADNAKGIYVKKSEGINTKSSADNLGEILIDGQESIGMYADNSEITNDGIIKLNIFQEDGKTLSNNKAMYGINEAIVKNTGSIYLTDVTSEKVSEDEFLKLEEYVNNSLITGDKTSVVTHTGVVRNKDGAIIIAAGEDIGGLIPDLEVNENGDYIVTDEYVSNLDKNIPLTTDRTLAFNGDKLDLNINANSDFDANKHLVSLTNNEKVTVSGNLIGADKGIMIDNSIVGIENSKIEVNIANENNIALEFKNESKGNILGTTVIGNISLNNQSDVKFESSKIVGDINLDQSSSLALDKTTTESFDGVIKGNNNGSKVVLGEDITRFNGTIENIDNVETNGILVMGEKSNFINSSVDVKDENLLVIRVGEGENDYALSDNVGTITLAENGHMMIETGRADIKPGDVINLGTTIVGDSANIHASQYIYDISLAKIAKINEGSQLIVTLKNATDLGLDSQVSDVYDSLASTGRLSGLVSVGTGKDVNELNSLLNQNVNGNAYALGDKVSKDSIKSWNDTVKNNINFLNPGEFEVSGLGMGAFEDANANVDYDFSGTGLMVMGEYGYDSKTTLGFSLGGGAVSGELDSDNKASGDSFYMSAFGKKAIDEILLTANIGYQFNKLKGKRAVGNAYESYNFSEKFDTNGFNIDLEARYVHALNNGFTIEPHLGVNVISVKQDSITEDIVDGALAMEIDSFSNTTLETKVGIELAKNIVTNTGSKVKLFGDLSYVNNSGDVDKDLTGKFIGATSDFDVKPVEIGKNKGELTLGGKVELTSGIFTDAKVAYSFGDNDYTKVTIGLGYTF